MLSSVMRVSSVVVAGEFVRVNQTKCIPVATEVEFNIDKELVNAKKDVKKCSDTLIDEFKREVAKMRIELKDSAMKEVKLEANKHVKSLLGNNVQLECMIKEYSSLIEQKIDVKCRDTLEKMDKEDKNGMVNLALERVLTRKLEARVDNGLYAIIAMNGILVFAGCAISFYLHKG